MTILVAGRYWLASGVALAVGWAVGVILVRVGVAAGTVGVTPDLVGVADTTVGVIPDFGVEGAVAKGVTGEADVLVAFGTGLVVAVAAG